ncbi:MAG: hypothetical protein VKK80_15605 [Prochlorothrix sp.]|nr:hypothetical protein [Prochlorothrix sp.]
MVFSLTVQAGCVSLALFFPVLGRSESAPEPEDDPQGAASGEDQLGKGQPC